jgi:hypothetical protein
MQLDVALGPRIKTDPPLPHCLQLRCPDRSAGAGAAAKGEEMVPSALSQVPRQDNFAPPVLHEGDVAFKVFHAGVSPRASAA